jgi:hypothetical protein
MDSFPSVTVVPLKPPRRLKTPWSPVATARWILVPPTTVKRIMALPKRTRRDMKLCLSCQSLSLVIIPTASLKKRKMLTAVIDKISRERMKALSAAMQSIQKLRAWCHDNVVAEKLCVAPSSQQEHDETDMCELTIFGFIGVKLARAGLKSRWGPPFEGHSVDILLSTLDMPVMALTGCHEQCKAHADRAVADVFNEIQAIADGVVGFELSSEGAAGPGPATGAAATPEFWSSARRTSGSIAGTKRGGGALFPDSFKRAAV